MIQYAIHFYLFHLNSIQQKIQKQYFTKIQFKRLFKIIYFRPIQFKIQFKTLKLAGFNSTKYSFNLKMWVSIRATQSPSPPWPASAGRSRGAGTVGRLGAPSNLLPNKSQSSGQNTKDEMQKQLTYK